MRDGELFDGDTDWEGHDGSDWQASDECWVADSGASIHITPNAEHTYNMRPSKAKIIAASGITYDIKGYGTLCLNIRSRGTSEFVKLNRVAYVPDMKYHLFSLRAAVDAGNRYEGTSRGVTVFLRDGNEIDFPLHGKLNYSYASRRSPPHYANAVIAPGAMPVPPTVDINLFHASYGHAHEGLLRQTAKDLGVTLTGELQPCTGCSMAKGLRKGISSSTENRATKKLGRVFVDLNGPKPESEGRKRYT